LERVQADSTQRNKKLGGYLPQVCSIDRRLDLLQSSRNSE
jgi:hypothetical protein